LGTEDDGNELLFISLKKLVAAGRQAAKAGCPAAREAASEPCQGGEQGTAIPSPAQR
jgi:hypothetical protein